MTRQEIVDSYGVSEETQKAISEDHRRSARWEGGVGTWNGLKEKYGIEIDKLMNIVVLQDEMRREK